MNYRLIGIDLDGTLLNEDGDISPANRDALLAAQDAGVMVVPCTGRAWHEAHFVLDGVPGLDLGVFITGAMVAQIDTGASVDLSLIEPHVALEVVKLLWDEPEAVLVFQEPTLAGHHYLVTGRGELTHNTRAWFEITGASVHFQREVSATDLHHTLRVGAVAPVKRMAAMERKIHQAMGGRVQAHYFPAVNMNHEVSDDDAVGVLEVFASGAHKWRGLTWIAQQCGIASEQIAAIGDQVNDLTMIAHAGCGIAMGNAATSAKEAANHVTRTNVEHGVAYAIEQLLGGAW